MNIFLKKSKLFLRTFSTNNKIADLHFADENKISKGFIIYNIFQNLPIYFISCGILINSNFLFLPLVGMNMIDLSRICMMSNCFSQSLITGINISSIVSEINNKVKLDKDDIHINVNMYEEEIKLKKQIKWNLFPLIINFSTIQILLNSLVLTPEMLLFSYMSLLFSNGLNLYFLKKTSNLSFKDNYIKINFIFLLLNYIALTIIFHYFYTKVKQGTNPLQRENDPIRLNINRRSDIIKLDHNFMELENNDIWENIPAEKILELEKFFEEK